MSAPAVPGAASGPGLPGPGLPGPGLPGPGLPRGTRCAVHPARPAVDRCPVCHRARCGADAAAATGGVRGLPRGDVAPRRVPAGPVERLVAAALAATVGALVWGVVASEYVGSTGFGEIAPAILGVVAGGAALKAARSDGSGPFGTRVRAVACVYAVLGTAFSFVAEDNYQRQPFTGAHLLPYAASLAGALLWTLPPRRPDAPARRRRRR